MVERKEMTWITATILAVLVLGGGGYYLEYYEITGIRDLCSDGEIWVQQDNSSLYYCPSEDSYQYCSRLSASERSCYVLELIGTGEVPTTVRTRSTETICNDGTCNLVLYSGTRFVEEDGIWKKVEEARSLKGKGFNIVIKNDGTHIIDVVDFNMTYIELNFSYDKNNLGEFELEVEDGKMKTKYKIVETLFNETTGEPYDFETEQEIEIEEDTQRNIILNGNPFGKRFKLGENSTTIILQDADTENLEDAFVAQNFANNNFGTNVNLEIGEQSLDSITVRKTFIKFNISEIPSGQVIDLAELNLYEFIDNTETADTFDTWEVSNQSWSETVITWNNPPSTGALISETNNPTVGVADGFIIFTVTTWVSNQYIAGNSNVSFAVNKSKDSSSDDDFVKFHSKEFTTDITLRPYLNITFSEPPPPTVNLDSPSNNTFSNVLNQIFNSSYTANIGSLVNATLNIWNSTPTLVFNETESVTGSSNSSSINFTFSVDDVYVWNYEVCDDSVLCASNATNFTITIDTVAPTFDNLADQNSDVNNSFSFDIDATDSSGISCFTVNDTTNFQIDCDGILQNNTELSVQVYALNITVNDTADNSLSGQMSVNVSLFDTILKWDWAALTTDGVSPDQICFIFRGSEEYCIDGDPNFPYNVTFEKDVTILGTLFGGSPVKIAGGLNITSGNLTVGDDISLEFGDLVSEQNPDAVDAIRIKASGSDVDVVLGGVTDLFSVWNAADTTPVFFVNNIGNTDILGDLTIGDDIFMSEDGIIGISASSERILFDGTGGYINLLGANVGIGTTSPQNLLNVIGDGNFTGNMTIGNKLTFSFGEFIDNLVDGWLRITGNLNVTGNITSENVFIPQYIFSHTNETIPLTTASVWQNVTFSQEVADLNFGFTHNHSNSTNHTFTFSQSGIYEINYDFDVEDTSVGASDIDVAGRVVHFNRTEVIGSVFETDITKQGTEVEISHDFLASFSAGDRIIFQFVADDADVQISTHGTFGVSPESATIVIKKIANLP